MNQQQTGWIHSCTTTCTCLRNEKMQKLIRTLGQMKMDGDFRFCEKQE